MRETWGLFLILAGVAFIWVAIHGYQGAGVSGVMDTIYGGLSNG